MSENRTPLEMRSVVSIGEVDAEERLIEVISVPYDEVSAAPILYRNEWWKEVFDRSAFADIVNARHDRKLIMVNREHTRGDTVGKVVKWWPERSEGLVAEVQVANTVRGDETLALAKEGMARASIGFGVKPSGQILDRKTMTRRIIKAFIDHLSFVEDPAYAGAEVLSVRADEPDVFAANLPPITERPAVDELAAFLQALRERSPRR